MAAIVDPTPVMLNHKPQLREEYGRSFNNTNASYILPADVAEHSRLDRQSEMFKHLFKGLVVPEAAELVQRALSSAEKPAVLDVGTGSGSWSIDMAMLYPNARVVGIDLAPVNPGRPIPLNCEFEVHDANTGMKPYHGQFDIMHCRCVSHGILNWKAFLAEAAECLKPGGVLLAMGADGMRLFNERREPIMEMTPGKEGFSHFNRLTDAARMAGQKRRGGDIEVHSYTQDWIKAMDGKFVDCGRGTYLVPLGAWEENLSEDEKITAELQRQNFASVTDSFRPALMSSGLYSPEEVDEIIESARDEVENVRFKQYVRWYGVWAVRS